MRRPFFRRRKQDLARIERVVIEQLERRCLLAAPQVLAPPPPVPYDGTPDGHFNMQFGPQRLIFNFSEPVNVAAGALQITNLTTGQPLTEFTETGTGDTRTFNFTSTGTHNEPNTVPRGNYQTVLKANLVTSVSTGEPLDGNGDGTGGDDYFSSFFFQPGDLNHDRRVNIDDYGRIDGNINKNPQPQGYSEGDVNYDGKINIDDYGIMDGSIGSSPLPEPPDVTLTASAVSTEQIDLSWATDLAGVEAFRMEVAFDGSNFHPVSENNATFSSASAVELPPNTTYHYRIVAFDASGDLGTSNTAIATTFSEGAAPISIAEAPAAPAPNSTAVNYLVAFNGARLGVEPIVNFWFSEAIEQTATLLTNVHPEDEVYPDNNGFTATTRLFSLIDLDSNNVLTAQEIANVEVYIAGLSWGAVTAVNVSRQLTASQYAGYTLEAQIPVKVLALVDPVNEVGTVSWLIRHVHGPVKTNVEKFRSYYHRNQHTPGIIDYGFGGGQFFFTDSWGNTFSNSLIGAVIPSDAADTQQTRIDTTWANREVIQQYSRGEGDPTSYEGRQFGRDINHDTMPWYTRKDYLSDLGVASPT